MLKQTQNQRLQQKLSPQQIQYIKMLQIPTVALESRIKEELEENPALSLVEDGHDILSNPETATSDEDFFNDEETTSDAHEEDAEFLKSQKEMEVPLEEYLQDTTNDYPYLNDYGEEEERYEKPIVQRKSLYDSLIEQIGFLDLTELEYIIAEQIVGSIDEDGYLRREIESITDELIFKYNLSVTDEQVLEVLKKVQTIEPAGIAARNLQECLLLQMERNSNIHKLKEWKIAYKIIKDFFDELAKKHYDKIIQRLNIDVKEFKEAEYIIKHLNPKPGDSQSDSRLQTIVPDFILSFDDNDNIQVKLNKRNAPELKVSDEYLKMLEKYQQSHHVESRETIQFIKTKIDSAKYFIDAILQRQITLYKTMMAIVKHQKDFFLSEGDESQLKPMILKTIADDIQMDISTVSRVVNNKFVETPFGMYELKFFFSEGIQTDSGEEVSNKEVKKILKEVIDNEDKTKPLSDDKLEKILKEKGYDVARRTVAKYREQLGIPVARLRKQL